MGDKKQPVTRGRTVRVLDPGHDLRSFGNQFKQFAAHWRSPSNNRISDRTNDKTESPIRKSTMSSLSRRVADPVCDMFKT